MDFMRNLLVSSLALLLLFSVPGISQVQKPHPSLDLLVSRIDSYWKLLLQKRKLQASQYIVPSDRENFEASDLPPFSNPRLKSIELSADSAEAKTVVTVMRTFLPQATVMEWPVTEQWKFEKGNWYRQISPRRGPMNAGESAASEAPDSEQLEKEKRELREMLRFEKTVFDFGTVRVGASVHLNLKYSLSGNEPLVAKFNDFAEGFMVRGLNDQKLSPGQQELSIEVPTWNYDGAVSEHVALIAYRHNVEIPFEFTIQGNVYVPVSAPGHLRFKEGETEKEILVRNNSKSDLELLPSFSELGAIIIEPLPTSIRAGQQAKLKVKIAPAFQTVQRNTIDNMAISFAHPVDGVPSLGISFILNYHEVNPSQLPKLPDDSANQPKKECRTCDPRRVNKLQK
jgi:hypothetical protein